MKTFGVQSYKRVISFSFPKGIKTYSKRSDEEGSLGYSTGSFMLILLTVQFILSHIICSVSCQSLLFLGCGLFGVPPPPQ